MVVTNLRTMGYFGNESDGRICHTYRYTVVHLEMTCPARMPSDILSRPHGTFECISYYKILIPEFLSVLQSPSPSHSSCSHFLHSVVSNVSRRVLFSLSFLGLSITDGFLPPYRVQLSHLCKPSTLCKATSCFAELVFSRSSQLLCIYNLTIPFGRL